MENKLYPDRYGLWSGDPTGRAPNFNNCCARVSNRERFTRFFQCERKRGFGPDEAYCKQHSPEAQANRNAKSDASYKEKRRNQRIEWYAPRFLNALQQIADGHNDPRTLAKDIIADFESE